MSALVSHHPRHLELIERRRLRRRIASAVERLIAVLDDLDGDPDLEPWLGAPEPDRLQWTYYPQLVFGVDQRLWAQGANDDREHDPSESGIGDDGGLSEQMQRGRPEPVA